MSYDLLLRRLISRNFSRGEEIALLPPLTPDRASLRSIAIMGLGLATALASSYPEIKRVREERIDFIVRGRQPVSSPRTTVMTAIGAMSAIPLNALPTLFVTPGDRKEMVRRLQEAIDHATAAMDLLS